jgi:hypothetical protein
VDIKGVLDDVISKNNVNLFHEYRISRVAFTISNMGTIGGVFGIGRGRVVSCSTTK